MDSKLEQQHDISVLPFGVVVVGAPSNGIKYGRSFRKSSRHFEGFDPARLSTLVVLRSVAAT